jgi:hypothetical protein
MKYVSFEDIHIESGKMWDNRGPYGKWKHMPSNFGREIMERSVILKFVIDYPLTNPKRVVMHRAGGWTVNQFIDTVIKSYKKVYHDENKAIGGDPGHIPGMLNRVRSAGPYGIWGHDLGDLILTGAYKGLNGIWRLDINS